MKFGKKTKCKDIDVKKILILISFYFLFMAFISPVYSADDKSKPNYNGHFGDMDLDKNDHVNWTEFKQFFPHADENVFKKADENNDGSINHDEWHKFKEANGYGHKNKD